jgi:hypothetical protein
MSYIDCEYCGEECYAERSNRKYCCNGCKSMANRQRRIDEEKARRMVKYLKKKRLIDQKEAKLREISNQEKQQKLLDKNRQLKKRAL